MTQRFPQRPQALGIFPLPALERVRTELREIVKFLEREGGKTFTTDIDDVVVDGGAIDAPITPMTYRQRVFDYLARNRNLPVLQKITHIRQLTAEDIAELERILWSELGSKNEYERYVARMLCGDNVGVFIRSIIGIDRAEAERLFSELISSTVVLNSQQEEYLKTIITYVCANGDIDADTLINRHPFSEYDWLTAFGPPPCQCPRHLHPEAPQRRLRRVDMIQPLFR